MAKKKKQTKKKKVDTEQQSAFWQLTGAVILLVLAFFLLLGFTIWSLSDLLKEFTLNEFYRFMESGYGIALQQIAANAWNYLASTTIGQQTAGLLGLL